MSAATNIPISATTTGFVSAIAAARASVGSLTGALNTDLSTAFRGLDRQTRLFESGVGRVGAGLSSLGKNLSTFVTLPILAAGAAAFKTYADIDALQKGLNNISGSAAAGAKEFVNLREVAKLPGLGLEEAVRGSVSLQAVGFSAENARKALLSFGNAVALTGGGKTELNTVITQLGQLAGKGKVLSEDLKPIISSATAIVPTLKRLFGTVNPEEISGKLKAAGKDSQFFVEVLTQELGKLEKVSGGPKNAIENLGDSLKIASFNFFAVADSALGLTDKLTGIGDFVTGLAESFSKLSPTTQQVILGAVGFAAVLGPLAVAIGGIIALVPAVISGAAAITAALGVGLAPIAGIGLAVAGTAVLIATNWGRIKTILTDSGIWQSVTGLVTSAIDTIKGVFSLGVDFLTAYWKLFGGSITTIASGAFGAVAAIFRTAAGVLSGVFKLVTGVLTGNWAKFGEGLQNITVSVFNGITSLFTSGFKVILGLTSGLLNSVGLSGPAASLDKYAASLKAITVQLKNTTNIAKETAKGLELPGVTVTAKKSTAPGIVIPNFTGAGLSGIAQLKADLKAAKEEVQSIIATKGIDAVPADKLARVKELAAKLKEAQQAVSLTKPKTAKVGVDSDLQLNERIAKDLERQIQNLGGAAPQALINQLAAIRGEIERIKALTDKTPVNLGKLRPAAPTGNFANAFATLSGIAPKLPGLDRLRENLDEAQKAIKEKYLEVWRMTSLGAIELPGFRFELFDASSASLKTRLDDLSQNLTSGLQGVAQAGLSGMGQIIGGLIAGTASLSDIPKLLGKIFGDLAKTMGQALIAFGTAGLALKAFQTTPITAIIAGVGLVALGSALEATVSKQASTAGLARFAKGGVFDQPSVGLFGEYAGATRNREIATPENLMRDIFRGEINKLPFDRLQRANSGNVGTEFTHRIEVAGVIAGKDLALVQRRHEVTQTSYGSR